MSMAHAPWDGDEPPADNVQLLEVWRSELKYKADGQHLEPKMSANFRVLLTNHGAVKGHIRLNEFTGQIEVGSTPWNRRSPARPLDDLDAALAREWLQGLGLQPTKSEARDALIAAARAQAYHPVRDYLGGLHWDGVERLDMWLSDFLGAVDSPYVRAVGRMALLGAVARVMKPGCKCDTVLILEGEQGLLKSTAIATLFSREYTYEAVDDIFRDHKRMVMQMQGKWVVELAEFAAVFRADQNAVKGLLSTCTDRTTLNYAVSSSDHPRQCIFMGTVNPDGTGYLPDNTGNRRYWPVECGVEGPVSIEGIAHARDQLWAEAVRRYQASERWWFDADGEQLARIEQSKREAEHPWDDLIMEKIYGFTEVTVGSVLSMIGVPIAQRQKAAEMIVAGALKRLGYKRGKTADGTGRVWRRGSPP